MSVPQGHSDKVMGALGVGKGLEHMDLYPGGWGEEEHWEGQKHLGRKMQSQR
jgi:hypothetical protein